MLEREKGVETEKKLSNTLATRWQHERGGNRKGVINGGNEERKTERERERERERPEYGYVSRAISILL